MNNIVIKFKGLGYGDIFQAIVVIYDSNNCIIYRGCTHNAQISLKLGFDCVYKIYAISGFEVIKETFYVDKFHSKYIFSFPRVTIQDVLITFLLTDAHYDGLPIERGDIIYGKDS